MHEAIIFKHVNFIAPILKDDKIILNRRVQVTVVFQHISYKSYKDYNFFQNQYTIFCLNCTRMEFVCETDKLDFPWRFFQDGS